MPKVIVGLVVTFFVTLLGPLLGAVSGFIVGFVFDDTMRSLLEWTGMGVEPWQLGAVLCWIGGFFRIGTLVPFDDD